MVSEGGRMSEELRQACWKWQRRLALTDWTVQIAVLPASEMTQKGCDGCISYAEEGLKAKIEIDAEDADKEKTLVHELLHLRVEDWLPRTKAANRSKERHIEWLVQLLSKAYPQRRKRERNTEVG
jgi:hypothetical protein